MSIRLYLGDAAKELKKVDDESVDLIVTSPPYADQRNQTYGGIHPDEYVEWFMPIASELQRVLKQTGTFVLNIKERVVAGERQIFHKRLRQTPLIGQPLARITGLNAAVYRASASVPQFFAG